MQNSSQKKLPVNEIPMFFIIGRARSGTTMLRTILDAHPNIVIPLECKLITPLFNKYKQVKLWKKNKIEELYNDIIALPEIETWTLNKPGLKEDLLNCEETIEFSDLIKHAYLNYISFFDKESIKLIGDKNPWYSLDIPSIKLLLKLYPQAKFIHIVRDYRDNYLSLQKFEFEGNHLSLVCVRWRESFRKIRRLFQNHSQQYYYIKYEDLVSDPSEHVKKICSFLSVDYCEEMLNYYKVKDKVVAKYSLEQINQYQSSLLQPINSEKVFGWKKKLSERKVVFADSIVGDYAEIAGYERRYKKKNLMALFLTLPDMLYLWILTYYTKIFFLVFPNDLIRKKRKSRAKLYHFALRLFRNLV